VKANAIDLVFIGSVPAYEEILYDLLAERTEAQSISHREMPTRKQHSAFILGHPYLSWCFIKCAERGIVGSVYLTRQNELGVSVFRKYQRMGYGELAVRGMMEIWGTGSRFLANINPANEASAEMFKKLGFKLVQHTYALDP
jgi:RimJ/RimL family protein N-acetyltransferase